MTIRDNIAYGDNRRNITNEEIIEAARLANIHEFILTLPKVSNWHENTRIRGDT
jgi:ABC-type multidrug transport system fused ATPase/permease subunit